MVILGEVLVAGGSALVVCSAIFWTWSAIKQKLLRGPDAGRTFSTITMFRKPEHMT